MVKRTRLVTRRGKLGGLRKRISKIHFLTDTEFEKMYRKHPKLFTTTGLGIIGAGFAGFPSAIAMSPAGLALVAPATGAGAYLFARDLKQLIKGRGK